MGTHPPVHPLLRRLGAIVGSVLVCGGLTTVAIAAGAAPQPTVSQVQAKIDKLTSQQDQAVQQYDQSAQELASANQQLALVNREVSMDRARFQSMRAEIAQIATTAYENGNMSGPRTADLEQPAGRAQPGVGAAAAVQRPVRSGD